MIKFRWGALPDEQREGIKTYISNLIIKLCTDNASFRTQRAFLNKMNVVLVQVQRLISLQKPANFYVYCCSCLSSCRVYCCESKPAIAFVKLTAFAMLLCRS